MQRVGRCLFEDRGLPKAPLFYPLGLQGSRGSLSPSALPLPPAVCWQDFTALVSSGCCLSGWVVRAVKHGPVELPSGAQPPCLVPTQMASLLSLAVSPRIPTKVTSRCLRSRQEPDTCSSRKQTLPAITWVSLRVQGTQQIHSLTLLGMGRAPGASGLAGSPASLSLAQPTWWTFLGVTSLWRGYTSGSGSSWQQL